MHIILALLGSVVTILVLLSRLTDLGIRLPNLNPFLWWRRRQWRQRYEEKPLYSLTDPQEVAALLLVITAKIDGDMSSEQKEKVLNIFENQFHLSAKQAEDYLTSSIYLIRDELELISQVPKILESSKPSFSETQVNSILDLMTEVSICEGQARQVHRDFINEVRAELQPTDTNKTWS